MPGATGTARIMAQSAGVRLRVMALVAGCRRYSAVMGSVLADDGVAAAFARDGVVCLRGVLDAGEVAAAAGAIDPVLARPGPLAQVASGAGGPRAFTGDFCRWGDVHPIHTLARDSPVPPPAPALL